MMDPALYVTLKLWMNPLIMPMAFICPHVRTSRTQLDYFFCQLCTWALIRNKNNKLRPDDLFTAL